jgi:thymidylate synthase
MQSADLAWTRNLERVFTNGQVVSPRPGSPFTGNTLEVMNCSSTLDMTKPVVTIAGRKLGYRFLAAEARWILTGDNRVASIAPYSNVISKFSDNGIDFFGAYGPRVVSQLGGVISALVSDQSTRQAVMSIWRMNPPVTKDVPCTTTVQWLIRDGALHCIDTMRSSDLWLGWPYDVFNFSMLSAMIALILREEHGIHLNMGNLSLNAGSQHLYERNHEQAKLCVSEPDAVKYAPLQLRNFANAESLIAFLGNLADAQDRTHLPWLGELFV